MKKSVLFLIIYAFSLGILQAQGFAFGPKGGLTLGSQKWQGSFNRSLQFAWHGSAFLESLSDDNQFSVFAELGYHVKGSAIRSSYTDLNNNFVTYTENYKFNNASLILGGKKKQALSDRLNWYYSLGLRLDYTLSTDWPAVDEQSFAQVYYPQKEFLRKFPLGFSLGSGIEFPISDYVGGLLEISVHPDFTMQYQAPSFKVYNPVWKQWVTLPEQNVRNLAFEMSLGIRFLRKVIYED